LSRTDTVESLIQVWKEFRQAHTLDSVIDGGMNDIEGEKILRLRVEHRRRVSIQASGGKGVGVEKNLTRFSISMRRKRAWG